MSIKLSDWRTISYILQPALSRVNLVGSRPYWLGKSSPASEQFALLSRAGRNQRDLGKFFFLSTQKKWIVNYCVFFFYYRTRWIHRSLPTLHWRTQLTTNHPSRPIPTTATRKWKPPRAGTEPHSPHRRSRKTNAERPKRSCSIFDEFFRRQFEKRLGSDERAVRSVAGMSLNLFLGVGIYVFWDVIFIFNRKQIWCFLTSSFDFYLDIQEVSKWRLLFYLTI